MAWNSVSATEALTRIEFASTQKADASLQLNSGSRSFNFGLFQVAVGTPVDLTPPARIRTCRITACGSYLGCLASKRRLG
jgi:hypothetical protein